MRCYSIAGLSPGLYLLVFILAFSLKTTIYFFFLQRIPTYYGKLVIIFKYLRGKFNYLPGWLTYCRFILLQCQVVSTQWHTVYYSCDIFKAVNPLFTFWPLSSNIKQSTVKRQDNKFKNSVSNKKPFELICTEHKKYFTNTHSKDSIESGCEICRFHKPFIKVHSYYYVTLLLCIPKS